jgi:hypothetical protein
MGREYRSRGIDKKYIHSFSRKTEGKCPVGRLGCSWKGNIRLSIKRHGRRVWTRFIWLGISTSVALLNKTIYLQILLKSGHFLSDRTTIDFSRRTLLFGLTRLLTTNNF